MVDVVVDGITDLCAEGEEEVVPAMLDAKVGITGIKFEINVVTLAIKDRQHHVVEFGVESCGMADVEYETLSH